MANRSIIKMHPLIPSLNTVVATDQTTEWTAAGLNNIITMHPEEETDVNHAIEKIVSEVEEAAEAKADPTSPAQVAIQGLPIGVMVLTARNSAVVVISVAENKTTTIVDRVIMAPRRTKLAAPININLSLRVIRRLRWTKDTHTTRDVSVA